MAIKICVQRTWRRRVKSSMLHAISLARYCMAAISGKAATSHDHQIRWSVNAGRDVSIFAGLPLDGPIPYPAFLQS